jgi:hypothetical protein
MNTHIVTLTLNNLNFIDNPNDMVIPYLILHFYLVYIFINYMIKKI